MPPNEPLAEEALIPPRDIAGIRIGSGMTADVNLLSGKRSLMSYILTSITRLQDNVLREMQDVCHPPINTSD